MVATTPEQYKDLFQTKVFAHPVTFIAFQLGWL
jgi:hypothetical protein